MFKFDFLVPFQCFIHEIKLITGITETKKQLFLYLLCLTGVELTLINEQT